MSNIERLLKKHGFTKIKTIGEGSFGKAILVETADLQKSVCKVVDVSRAPPKERQDAAKEAKLLAQLKHPYIVRHRDNFCEHGLFCIVMDFCHGGDLTRRIHEARKIRQSIAEEQILRWITQSLLALKYIHEKHVLHRDLKPGNLFLSKQNNIKLGDFGIAKALSCTLACAKTKIGTPYYVSPEICQSKPYAWPSDVWAVGCILYELCALKVPFDASNIPSLVKKICHGPVPPIPAGYSDFTVQVCNQMLKRDPKARPSAGDILQRPMAQGIIRQMLEEERSGRKAQPEEHIPVAGSLANEVVAKLSPDLLQAPFPPSSPIRPRSSSEPPERKLSHGALGLLPVSSKMPSKCPSVSQLPRVGALQSCASVALDRNISPTSAHAPVQGIRNISPRSAHASVQGVGQLGRLSSRSPDVELPEFIPSVAALPEFMPAVPLRSHSARTLEGDGYHRPGEQAASKLSSERVGVQSRAGSCTRSPSQGRDASPSRGVPPASPVLRTPVRSRPGQPPPPASGASPKPGRPSVCNSQQNSPLIRRSPLRHDSSPLRRLNAAAVLAGGAIGGA